MTRIKEDICRNLMSLLGVDTVTSKRLVNDLIKELKKSLAAGDEVMISGFGNFKIRHKKARAGRNPKTKEKYVITERDVVTFYPSRVLRDNLNPQ
jgi:integration host factor subunit alpha